MKRFVLPALLLPTVVLAQGLGLGLQVGPQIPVGDFGKTFDVGFGGNFIIEYMLSPQFSINFTTGYHRWSASEQVFISGIPFDLTLSWTTIPMIAGATFVVFPHRLSPFIGMKIGLHIETATATIESESESDTETHFGLTPEVGLLFPLNPQLSLSVGAEYNHIFGSEENVTYFGILAGILIHLGGH